MDSRISEEIESRWRLRAGSKLVGYMRELPSGVRLYARDRLYWTGSAIEHDARDRWSGLRDANRDYVFDGDVVFVRPFEAAGEHPQWVVATQPLRLQSLDATTERPLLGDDGAPLYNFNELRIVTHVWRSKEIQMLRSRREAPPTSVGPPAAPVPAWHLACTAVALGCAWLFTEALSLWWMLLGQVVGAWLGLHRGRAECADLLGRRHIRRLSVVTGVLHGVAAAGVYALLYYTWPSAFELSPTQVLWAAPAVGFLVGLTALASLALVGDVMAHRDGGYSDDV